MAERTGGTAAAPQAEWTWLIFMAGDNDLETAGEDDLGELMQVGSTDQVQVIVQFDTKAGGTTRYRVGKGQLELLEALGTTNTGEAGVLAAFVAWGRAKFPSKRLLLDVWNHGGGWKDLPADFDYESMRTSQPRRAMKVTRTCRSLFKTSAQALVRRPERTRAIAIDTGSHDYLDNQELRKAIRAGLGKKGQVDLLGLDACLMSMLEIAYELRDVAGLLVGSEETEPAAGWPYQPILQALVEQPGLSARQLAPIIVREYGKYFRAEREIATQSALDLGRIEPLRVLVDDLADALLARLKAGDAATAGHLSRARASALHFQDSPEYLDLADLCRQLVARVKVAKVRAAAEAVLQALRVSATDGFVVANAVASRSMERAGGVAIYFPETDEGCAPDYARLQFSAKGRWNELLEAVAAS